MRKFWQNLFWVLLLRFELCLDFPVENNVEDNVLYSLTIFGFVDYQLSLSSFFMWLLVVLVTQHQLLSILAAWAFFIDKMFLSARNFRLTRFVTFFFIYSQWNLALPRFYFATTSKFVFILHYAHVKQQVRVRNSHLEFL